MKAVVFALIDHCIYLNRSHTQLLHIQVGPAVQQLTFEPAAMSLNMVAIGGRSSFTTSMSAGRAVQL